MALAATGRYPLTMSNQDVIAPLRYLVPGAERPIYFASRGGADAELRIGARFEDREVLVRDARQLDPPASLARQGFTLLPQTTSIVDFYALDPVRVNYEAEIVELVLSVTNAADARVFDHTLRSDSRDIRGQHATREPATVIHNDYTHASARKRLCDMLAPSEAEQRLQRRFAIINIWRSISGPVIASPLACCDAATLAVADLVASERRAQERIGELELVTWNPAHQWYYYPEMTRDEVLLIKTFDSDAQAGATRSIHTAFPNPLAPPDAPPRESIESRVFVFY